MQLGQLPVQDDRRRLSGEPRCLPEPALRVVQPPSAAGRSRPATTALRFESLLLQQFPELDPELLYHPGHTWVRAEGPGRARVGLDPFAATIVTRPRSIIVTSAGSQVRRGHPCAWLVESNDTQSILAPLSGHVAAINSQLQSAPGRLQDDPCGEGWLFLLEPSNLEGELRRLEAAPVFARRLGRDAERWRRSLKRLVRQHAPAASAALAEGRLRGPELETLLGRARYRELAAYFLAAGRATR
jgi:glycine cleavage system H lipoate-binding protein